MPGGHLTLGQFAVKLATFTAELPESTASATAKAALHVTNSVRGRVRADSGGDMRLSGVGVRGARVGARYDIKGFQNPTALIRATGPMQFLESPTSPHEIRPRRRRGKRALSTPYDPRRSVQHPGSPGKKTWTRGVDAAVGEVPRIYQKELRRHLQRFFG